MHKFQRNLLIAIDVSHSTLRSARQEAVLTLNQMEAKAREILRYALAAHYVDGAEGGQEIDAWLKKHGGWLPDPQELYGDGTPLTQPQDEGFDVSSPFPEDVVLKDATRVILLLRATWPVPEDDDAASTYANLHTDIANWLRLYAPQVR